VLHQRKEGRHRQRANPQQKQVEERKKLLR
jgi:hypothetical protein